MGEEINEELEVVNCPVCDSGSQSVIWLEDIQPTRFMRCLGCETIYASPRTSHRSRYAWLDHTFSVSEGLFQVTETRKPALKLEAEFIQKHIKSGRLIDIGCSVGAFYEFFPRDLWELYGVELSKSAAIYAMEHYKSNVHIGTLKSASYKAGFFDLAALIDTLYYIDDPVSELNEIKRILKPGGILAIEIAGQAYILLRNYGYIGGLFLKHKLRGTSNTSYIYWFSPKGLSKLLQKCGLEPFAWKVIPSPRHSKWIINVMTGLHYKLVDQMARYSANALSWAPKIIFLARK